jgi:hypothetical protein
MSISTRLLAVRLNIGQWQGNKKDKRETRELAIKHNLPSDVASARKTLLPNCKELAAVHKQTGTIRSYYYDRTVPWEYSRGVIKSDTYLQFAADMRGLIDEWHSKVDTFVNIYPSAVANAATLLNGMYDPSDYPGVSAIRSLFSLDLQFFPLAEAGNIVIDVANEAERQAAEAATITLRQQAEAEITASYARGMERVWERLYKVVAHAHERLSDPDNSFHDTLVTNAQDLVKILPSLNIANDPNLASMTDELSKSLCAHTPEVLKIPGITRAETASKMADIMKRMGAFYTA